MAPAAVKRTWIFKQGAGYFCIILNKFRFSRKVFIKVSNIKFYGNPPSGSRADAYRRTDGRTDEQPDNISPEEKAFVATE
jgi:hypothetical protein